MGRLPQLGVGRAGAGDVDIFSNTAIDATGTRVQPLCDSAGHFQIDVLTSPLGGYAEDAAHSSGDKGCMALVVRKDTAAQLAGTDGDYSPLINDANGRLHVLDPSTAAIKTAVEIMDDWDETDRCAVNLIAGQAAITAGAGAVAANTPRVTLASDDPAVVALQILDDWDETDRCKVNLIAGQAGITAGAGAVGTNTPRITLASDDPAVVALQILDDWDASDRCKVNTTDQPISAVDADTGAGTEYVAPVTIRTAASGGSVEGVKITDGTETANVTASNELNVLDSNSAAIKTAVELIDDAVHAEDAAHTTADKGVFALGVRQDTATQLAGTDGDYSPLITDANGRLHVLDANTAAIKTALEIMDDWDDGADHCNVVVASALPAGTNAIGKLAANSGVDIGDVDVTSVVPGTAATNLGKAEDAAHTSGDVGVMALSVRQDAAAALGGTDADYQPLITDANGRLHVLDANSAAIKTAVELLDNAISGNEMQVDIVASLPAGTNAIGKLAANSGVDIGDVDILSIAAGTNTIGKVYVTDGTTDLKLATTVVDVQGASALQLLAAGGAGNKHRIFLLTISADTAGLLTVSDGIGKHYIAASSNVTFDFQHLGQVQDTANTAITITNSGGGNLAATATYLTE